MAESNVERTLRVLGGLLPIDVFFTFQRRHERATMVRASAPNRKQIQLEFEYKGREYVHPCAVGRAMRAKLWAESGVDMSDRRDENFDGYKKLMLVIDNKIVRLEELLPRAVWHDMAPIQPLAQLRGMARPCHLSEILGIPVVPPKDRRRAEWDPSAFEHPMNPYCTAMQAVFPQVTLDTAAAKLAELTAFDPDAARGIFGDDDLDEIRAFLAEECGVLVPYRAPPDTPGPPAPTASPSDLGEAAALCA